MKKQLLLLTTIGFLLIWNFRAFGQQAAVSVPDSLALVALYNSTNGPGWKTQTNWLTQAPVATWFGLETSVNQTSGLNEILEIDLSNNNVSGTIPDSITVLDELQNFNVSTNFIKGLPADMSGMTALANFDCRNNRLAFGDLIPAIQTVPTTPGAAGIQYIPQDSLDFRQSLSAYVDDSLQIGFEDDNHPANIYEWLFFGDNITNNPTNVNRTFTIAAVDSFDAGPYVLRITNPQVPNLVLFSLERNVRVYQQRLVPPDLRGMTFHFQEGPNFTQAQIDNLRNRLDTLGFKLLDSCLCGEFEIWDRPDTLTEGLNQIIGPESFDDYFNEELPPREGQVSYNYPADTLLEDSSTAPWFRLKDPAINATLTSGATEVVVAVIDQGLDSSHSAFDGKIWENENPNLSNDICITNDPNGYNFLDKDGNPFRDSTGHATHISNLIAQTIPSSPVKLMSLQIGSKERPANVFRAACAFKYAIQHQVDVINLSMGYQGEKPEVLGDLIKDARDANIVVVMSAGNDTSNNNAIAHWPSNLVAEEPDSFLNALAVGASEPNDIKITSFSNFGDPTVNIAAPGQFIYSALPGEQFGVKSGTSMSNAFATALAAYLRAEYGVGATQIVQAIRSPAETWSIASPALLGLIKDRALLEVELLNCNEWPIAVNDSSKAVSGSVEINILANDCYEANLLPVVQSSSNGSAQFNPATRMIDYQPNSDFSGIDSFTYTLTPNGFPQNEVSATVYVEVESPGNCWNWQKFLMLILLVLAAIIFIAYLIYVRIVWWAVAALILAGILILWFILSNSAC